MDFLPTATLPDSRRKFVVIDGGKARVLLLCRQQGDSHGGRDIQSKRRIQADDETVR